jgi:hypothetical protein
MRLKSGPLLDGARFQHPHYSETHAGDMHGTFRIGKLNIISSGSGLDGCRGWEHVSISRTDRTPTWEEMVILKNLFWGPEETVLQFHPKESQYQNKHPFCLHLWKKSGVDQELPPTELV